MGWGLRDVAAASALFLAATVALGYPLSLHPASLGFFSVPAAQENAWALSFVAHQVLASPARLFEANALCPLSHTLALSEPLFAPALIALPVLGLTDDLLLSFNVVLLLSAFLSALGMYLLAALLTGSRAAALGTGILFGFAPQRLLALPHLDIQLAALSPFTLICLHRYLATGRARWAVGCAGSVTLLCLSATSAGLIAVVVVVVSGFTLVPVAPRRAARAAILTLALAVSGLIVTPFVLPQFSLESRVSRETSDTRDEPARGALAARPATGLASATLFAALGVVGLVRVASRRTRHSQPWAIASCYVLLSACGLLLYLAPVRFWEPLLDKHPLVFRPFASPAGFVILPLSGLSGLSAFALAWIAEHLGPSRRWVALAGPLVVLAAESFSLCPEPSRFADRPPEVYTWLANGGRPGRIVELPYRGADPTYLFWSRHHRFRSTLNGASDIVPVSHQWIRAPARGLSLRGIDPAGPEARCALRDPAPRRLPRGPSARRAEWPRATQGRPPARP